MLQKAVGKMMADPNYRKMYQNYKEAHGGLGSSTVSIYDSALAHLDVDSGKKDDMMKSHYQQARRSSMEESVQSKRFGSVKNFGDSQTG